MKKRVLSLLLILSMFAMTACGNNTDAGVENADDAVVLSQMDEVNTAELNMIDDKYRNYYEVFVYSFCDSDGDGIGDIQGLISKLDYINDGDPTTDSDLGCTGIWLMPIMPSTTYHKYDVINYKDIDSEYGTLEDFEQLIAECDERGIDVIIDLVLNHSSSQHPWFKEATNYLKNLGDAKPNVEECPYFDYYHFSKESASGYTKISGTDWYYECQFWSEMPDMNLGSEAVRTEFEEVSSFWLEKGVAGFRLDAAKEFYSGHNTANIEVLTWFNDYVKGIDEDAYIVAEVWNNMEAYSMYLSSGIDSVFNFDFSDTSGIIASSVKHLSGKNASSYGKEVAKVDGILSEQNPNYVDAPFYTNHDQARSAGYYSGEFGENQTKIALAMNQMMTGNTFLYYGDELGMKGSGQDENKRCAMQWYADDTADGMCVGPNPNPIDMKYGSLEEQVDNPYSIYNFAKHTIKLRNQYPIIARGDVTFEEAYSDDNICVLKKTYEGEEMVFVFNISSEVCTVDLTGLTVNGVEAKEATMAGVLITQADTRVEIKDGVINMPIYSVLLLK